MPFARATITIGLSPRHRTEEARAGIRSGGVEPSNRIVVDAAEKIRERLPDFQVRGKLNFATSNRLDLVTCNRDDFLILARGRLHSGLIIPICRKTRIAECAAVIRLIENFGETGLVGNINFA